MTVSSTHTPSRSRACRATPAVGLCLVATIASAVFAAGLRLMSVEMREEPVRTAPSFLGKVSGTVRYAERVQVIEDRDPWLKVKSTTGNVEGWIHRTALTKKRIVLKVGDTRADVDASSDEIALAGRGFNSQVEDKYRTTHQKLNYAWIDRMETFAVTPEEMAAFLSEGKIVPREGGLR